MPITEYTKVVYHYTCEVQENEHVYPRNIVLDICYATEDFEDKREGFSCGWTVQEDGKVFCPACSKLKVWEKECK